MFAPRFAKVDIEIDLFIGAPLLGASAENEFRFQPVPRQECTYEGLKAAYIGSFNFVKDGLLFYNKSGHYTKGLTPLVLAWRDRSTSRFSVDTPDGINPYPTQSCVLKLAHKSGRDVLVAHADDIVCEVPEGSIATWGASMGKESLLQRYIVELIVVLGDLIRFTVQRVAMVSSDQNDGTEDRLISVEGLKFEEICGRNRSHPDSSCKIMFQYMARTTPLKIEAIINAVKPT